MNYFQVPVMRHGTWQVESGTCGYYDAKPCAEHGDLPCKKHLSASYPESHLGLVLYRLSAGLPVVVLMTGLWFAAQTWGLWLLWMPIIAMFAIAGVYVLGWGVTACSRLVSKSWTD